MMWGMRRQRTPRGLMADVIDDLWREQPVPMMRWCASTLRLKLRARAPRALEILAELEADRVRSRSPAGAG
jgi:hypothetical protein